VRRPFKQEVRDVCGGCNNGWMSDLEGDAHRCLMNRPGESGDLLV
jgi:hypothetical protein